LAEVRMRTPLGEREVPLPVAVAVFLGAVLSVATVATAIGYRYFWGVRAVPRIEAEKARWEEETKKSPADPTAWTELGVTLYKKKDLAGAEKALRKAVELEPRADRARYFLGLVYLDRKEYDRAEAAFREILKRDIGNPLVFYRLAEVELGRKNYPRALENLDYINEYIDSSLREVHWLRGVVLEEMGKRNEAIEAYRRSAALDPDYQPAQEALRRLGVKPPRPEDVAGQGADGGGTGGGGGD